MKMMKKCRGANPQTMHKCVWCKKVRSTEQQKSEVPAAAAAADSILKRFRVLKIESAAAHLLLLLSDWHLSAA